MEQEDGLIFFRIFTAIDATHFVQIEIADQTNVYIHIPFTHESVV